MGNKVKCTFCNTIIHFPSDTTLPKVPCCNKASCKKKALEMSEKKFVAGGKAKTFEESEAAGKPFDDPNLSVGTGKNNKNR